jgi:hypothetical protein
MPFVTYLRDVPARLQGRVRTRYADDNRRLAALGFSDLVFYAEVLKARPSSYVMMILMGLRREVIFWHKGLRFGAAYLLMAHDDPFTVALPMGMGGKLYTPFTDGSLLIAASFPSEALPYGGRNVEKHTDLTSIENAWRDHRERVARAVAGGKTPRRVSTFDEFVELSLQEEGVLAERFSHLAD